MIKRGKRGVKKEKKLKEEKTERAAKIFVGGGGADFQRAKTILPEEFPLK